LLGIYSGTRAGAIAAASPIPAIGRSYTDLERGRYYRLKQGSAKTNKRQPTVPIPLRLLAHLRRWHRIDPEAKHFVEYNGKPVISVKTAFKSAVRLAGFGPGIFPHTLRLVYLLNITASGVGIKLLLGIGYNIAYTYGYASLVLITGDA
jgi:integrase